MAASTSRLVAGRRPVDDFRIRLMTFGTVEVAKMVQWLVGQPAVAVVGRCPRVRVVAQAAILRGVEVPGIHASRRRTVVARRTRSQYLVVIDGNHRRPDIGAVTVLTNGGRQRMQRPFAGCVGAVVTVDAITHDIGVVKVRGQPCDGRVAIVAVVTARDMGGVFADCRGAVVARATGADHLSMVDGECRYPGVRRVTVLAHDAGLNVVGVFAGCVRAVVTTRTVTRDVEVVEVRWQPAGCRMAVLAVFAACNMRRSFARRDCTVVAGSAHPDNLCVVDRKSRSPNVRVMAILTNIARLNVCEILARRLDTVVAAGAVASDSDVIEVGGQPSGRCMAVIAIVAGRNMCQMFAGCGRTVMAGSAGAENLRVIDSVGRCEDVGIVAVLADIRRLNVCWALADGVNAIVTTGTIVNDTQMIEVCRSPRNR